VLEFDQVLLAHTANPKNFKGQHLKLGLKFPHMRVYNFGVVGVTPRNFTRGCGWVIGMIMCALILQGCPYRIWEGKKYPKFGAIFDSFWLDRECLQNGSTYRKSEKTWSTTFHPPLEKKFWWTLVH